MKKQPVLLHLPKHQKCTTSIMASTKQVVTNVQEPHVWCLPHAVEMLHCVLGLIKLPHGLNEHWLRNQWACIHASLLMYTQFLLCYQWHHIKWLFGIKYWVQDHNCCSRKPTIDEINDAQEIKQQLGTATQQ